MIAIRIIFTTLVGAVLGTVIGLFVIGAPEGAVAGESTPVNLGTLIGGLGAFFFSVMVNVARSGGINDEDDEDDMFPRDRQN